MRVRHCGGGVGAGLVLAALLVTGPSAAPQTFSFEDPLERNAVAVTMESRLQPIRGLCEAVQGEMNFDPETGKLTGTIHFDTARLRFPGEELTTQLVGPEWFDFANRPAWNLTIKDSARSEALDEETWQVSALGAMVLRGQAGGINFPITVTYLEGGMAERSGGRLQGDLLILRGSLSFRREEYGVHRDPDLHDLYGPDVDLEFSLVGWAP